MAACSPHRSSRRLGAFELERFGELRAAACDAVTDAVEALSDAAAADDERVRDAVRAAIRQALDLPRQRRPILEVQVTRLGADTMAAFEPMEAAVP